MGEGEGGGESAIFYANYSFTLPLTPSHQGRGMIYLSKVDNQIEKSRIQGVVCNLCPCYQRNERAKREFSLLQVGHKVADRFSRKSNIFGKNYFSPEADPVF